MTPIEVVLSRLEGVRKTNNGWDALCPGHDDRRPSLGIAVTENGHVLLHCRSHNCNAEAICKAIGLKLTDLFSRNGEARASMNIVATYDYRDQAGNLLFQNVRLEPKDFRYRRPDPNRTNGWIWNLKGVKRVLYRLPDVLKAIAQEETVFLVEGEKDADRLVSLSIVATTNPGGASKWKKSYSETLRGARVILLSDNDDPGQRHVQKAASTLHGKATSVKVLNLPNLPPKGDVSNWLDNGGTVEELTLLAEATPEWSPDYTAAEAKADDDRPRIEITTEEHEVNAQAAEALARDQEIFQRGGLLIRVHRDMSPATDVIRRPFAPRMEPLPCALLRERLAANANWFVTRETENAVVEKPSHPPSWCVSAVNVRGQWPGIRHVEAVVEYPVLRPDGTLITRRGYDTETGLLLEMNGDFPVFPSDSQKDDAIDARNELLEVVHDFPFAQDVHKSAWLAALLTPLARFAFSGAAPLFLVDSNVRGAGKGLLLDCISRIITGERFTVATYTGDEDELRKRITSLALAGDRLVLFDNLEGKFGNAVLDAALTATSWKDRVLGGNRMAECPLYMTWYATGNNVAVAADTARRICHIRLESDQERPEERQDFRLPDLLRWVGENRGMLLANALTILRAYCAEGCPDLGLPAWGSFDGWSKLVRSAVVWVGLPDPGKTRLLLQEQADVAAEGMALLLQCWEKMDPHRRGLTAAEAVQRYKEPPESAPEYHADLTVALEALLGKPDSRGLGNKLRSSRRRVFNDRFIDHAGTEHRAVRWAVYPGSAFNERLKNTH